MMESKTDHDYNCNVETAEAVASLSQLVLREQQVERELTDLERDIYLTEGDYLAETAADGNIVRGWEGLLTSLELEVEPDRRYRKFKAGERIFSKSSVTAAASAVSDHQGTNSQKQKMKTNRAKRKKLCEQNPETS